MGRTEYAWWGVGVPGCRTSRAASASGVQPHGAISEPAIAQSALVTGGGGSSHSDLDLPRPWHGGFSSECCWFSPESVRRVQSPAPACAPEGKLGGQQPGWAGQGHSCRGAVQRGTLVPALPSMGSCCLEVPWEAVLSSGVRDSYFKGSDLFLSFFVVFLLHCGLGAGTLVLAREARALPLSHTPALGQFSVGKLLCSSAVYLRNEPWSCHLTLGRRLAQRRPGLAWPE